MKWNSFPFFRIFLGLASGILAYHSHWTFIFMIFAPSMFLLDWRINLRGLLLQSMIVGTGWTISNVRALPNYHAFENTIKVNLVGVLTSFEEKGKNALLQLKPINLKGRTARVLLKSPISVSSCIVGDTLQAQTILKFPSASKNPKVFDYRKFLWAQGISHVGNVRDGDLVIIPSSNKISPRRRAHQLKNFCSNIIDVSIPGLRANSIVKAIFLGQKKLVTKTDLKLFAETGALHVMAVSGLHVGVIMVLLGHLFQHLIPKRWKIVRALLILTGIWSFAFMTGLRPSVVRASIMFSLLCFGQQLYRESKSINTLFIAACLTLIIDPSSLFDLGFIFSYTAVLSILMFYQPIRKLINPTNAAVKVIVDMCTLSLSAQILILPISLYFFHLVPTFFLLSNLLVLPMASIILTTSIILFGVFPFSPALCSLIGSFLDQFIAIILFLLEAINELPCSKVSDVWLPLSCVLLSYTVIIMGLLWFRKNNKHYTYLLSALLLSLATTFAFSRIAKLNSSKLVIYHQPKGLAIDFFIKTMAFRWRGVNITKYDEQWTSAPLESYWAPAEIHKVNNPIVIKDKNMLMKPGMLNSAKECFLWEPLHLPRCNPCTLVLINGVNWNNVNYSDYKLKSLIVGAGLNRDHPIVTFAMQNKVPVYFIDELGAYTYEL